MVTISKVPVTTSVSMEPAAGHVSVLSETVSAFTETIPTIIERRSGSSSIELTPAMDIIDKLAHQMVQQIFTSMKSCSNWFFPGEVISSLPECFLKIRSRTFVILEVQS